MAYGKIYTGYTYNYYDKKIDVDIYKKDYTGSVTDINLASINILYNQSMQIISKSADIEFINTLEFDTFDDLLRNYERQYKCIITDNTGFQHFEGYMVVDINEQTFLDNSKIKLTFTDYIKRLKDKEPPNVFNVLGQRKKIIEIINDCLKATGFEKSLYINSLLFHENNTMTGGHTLFEQVYVDTDLFWENNIEKTSVLDVLNAILLAFNAFLFEYNSAWYIERYDEIVKTGHVWTQFAYDSTTPVTLANKRQAYTKQSGDFDYVGASQSISYVSGLNEYELMLDLKKYLTMVYNNFDEDVADLVDSYGVPHPALREWEYTKNTETGYETNIYKGLRSELAIQYPVWLTVSKIGTSWQSELSYNDNDEFVKRGIFTKFACSVTDDTALKLKWKAYKYSGPTPEFVRVYWYLRDAATNTYFIHYNETSKEWEYVMGIPDDKVNYEEINVENFGPAGLIDVDINIPLSDITGIPTGDQEFVFGVCYIVYKSSVDSELHVCDFTIHGDFAITASNSVDNNNILATINEGFINKKSESLTIFDIENLNLKNGLYINDAETYIRTSDWTDDAGTNYTSLIDHLLKSKYKFFNRNRLKLNGTLISENNMKPLSILYDNNLQRDGGTIPILLKSYKYNVVDCTYEIETDEYSEDGIILIKG
ncbi:MAG: hypothetical protein ACQESQ_08880 [Bacteroidota bacterium]